MEEFDSLLAMYPSSPRAAWGRARCLDAMADGRRSNALLEEGTCAVIQRELSLRNRASSVMGHSLRSVLLASLARSAALARPLTRSFARSRAYGTVVHILSPILICPESPFYRQGIEAYQRVVDGETTPKALFVMAGKRLVNRLEFRGKMGSAIKVRLR